MSPLRRRAATYVEAAMWMMALAGALTAFRPWISAPVAGAERARVRVTPIQSTLADSAYLDSVALAATEIVSRDPFRVSHAPSMVVYSPKLRESVPIVQSRPASRPKLIVRGILGGGTHWRAILLGVPGRAEAVLVAPGDTLGGLHVRRITRDTVFVRGADTSWMLTVRGEWQP